MRVLFDARLRFETNVNEVSKQLYSFMPNLSALKFGFCNVQTLIWTFSACGAAAERCGGFGHVQGGMALAAGSAPSSSRACAFCGRGLIFKFPF